VLLSWLVSGIVMILPRAGRGARFTTPAAVDYHSITLSPAEALRVLAPGSPGDPRRYQVAAVKLRAVLDQVVYEVLLAEGGTRLIDARSGQEVEITSTMAAEIARTAEGSTASTRYIERLEQHDLRWRYGALPVYRVALEDAGDPVLYVDAESGALVGRSDRWSRIRSVITSLHEFEPVTRVIGSHRFRKAAMLFFALVGIATVLTGYWLVVPRFRSRARTLLPPPSP
jgi:hypothetical protein